MATANGVMLACLAVDGWVRAELMHALAAGISHLGRPAELRLIQNAPTCADARNQAVQMFDESTCEWLVMHDHDTVPVRSDWLSIIGEMEQRGISVSSLPTPVGTAFNFALSIDHTEGKYFMPSAMAHGWFRVAWFGGAVLIIHRSALDQFARPIFANTPGAERPDEDVAFSLACAEKGMELWICGDYYCQHFKLVMGHERHIDLLGALSDTNQRIEQQWASRHRPRRGGKRMDTIR